MRVLVALSFVLCCLFAAVPDYYDAQNVENVEVFNTRGDKKIAVKWLEESKGEKGALIVAVNGGDGKWELRDSHITSSRIGILLAGMGNYRVLSIDMPSDEYLKGDGGYGSEVYRLSKYQIDDLKSVLNAVNKDDSPVYILSTSKGTISAANIAASEIKNLKGVILTAVSADLSKLTPFAKVKTLWIQHKLDKCSNIRAGELRTVASKASNSSFVEVTNIANVSGKECSMSNYHGFVERDMQIAKVIQDWIENRTIPHMVE